MEQQTFMIKNFLRIIYPDIHLRRMTYPPERIYLCRKQMESVTKIIDNRKKNGSFQNRPRLILSGDLYSVERDNLSHYSHLFNVYKR